MQAKALFENVRPAQPRRSLGRPARLRFGSARPPRVRQGSLAQSCLAPLPRPQSRRHTRSVIIGRSWWFRCTANARWSRGWRCEWAKQGKLELQGPASELLLVGAVCPMAPGMRRSKAEAGKRRRTLALETLESQVSRANQPRRLTAERTRLFTQRLPKHRAALPSLRQSRLLEPTKTPPWTPATTNSAARASN